MLELAYANQDELQKKYLQTKFNPKYKYYTGGYESYTLTIKDCGWYKHQFVSKKGDSILGYFDALIDRENNSIQSLGIINFTEPSFTFSKDLFLFLHKLFEYNFTKINWTVYVGNPIEKSYDKICANYGGRIIGIYKKHVKLYTGEVCDEKIYEILKEDYLKSDSYKKYKKRIN